MRQVDPAPFAARLAAFGPLSEGSPFKAQASDDTTLAGRLYLPAEDAAAALLFYHGGGAHAGAGYAALAQEISRRAPVAVLLADIRGHGDSGGERGHAPTPQQVWRDAERTITHLSALYPQARLYAGGHSSGAGLVLNWRTRLPNPRPVDGLLFLAPEFGFKARLHRRPPRGARPFARARRWPFVVNAFSGGYLGGGLVGVDLDMAGAGLVSRYTVNMALAVTPNDPARQIARRGPPIWVGIAENDEITDAEKLRRFVQPHAEVALLPGATHLGAILQGAEAIAGRLLRDMRL